MGRVIVRSVVVVVAAAAKCVPGEVRREFAPAVAFLLLLPLFARITLALLALNARALLANSGFAERPMLGAVPFARQLPFPGLGVIFPHSRRVACLGLIAHRDSCLRGWVAGNTFGIVKTQRSSSAACRSPQRTVGIVRQATRGTSGNSR
ncbi:hypothetical protein EDB89DRAFT_1952450 [Lactarius sanguifluus]|nr:hypothetical protein EDB89DRAFT_1952450 [Lactarius sanguifluus]